MLGAEALGIPAVLVRRPDPRAARYADSLAGVEPTALCLFLSLAKKSESMIPKIGIW